jgi:hypothetical protein
LRYVSLRNNYTSFSQIKNTIKEEVAAGDYATKKDIKDLEIKIEKGFKEVVICVVGAIVAVVALTIEIIKLF